MPPPGPVGAVAPPPGVTPNFENPDDVLHTVNLVAQILSMVIMTPFIVMRVYVKLRVAPPFLLDDSRVFGTFRATRISAWVIIVLMLCYYVPVFIIKVQVCRPISSYWDLSIKGVNLVSQRSLFVADTVMSTVSDVAVLLLPVPAIISLRMHMAQKLKIWCMLGLGGIATMASTVRMVIVIKLQNSSDQITIGVVCACLPALNILITRHRISSRVSTEKSESKFVDVLRSIKFLRGSKLQTAPPITPLRVTNNLTYNNHVNGHFNGHLNGNVNGPISHQINKHDNDNEIELR
ncbi:uncharacterized protein PG998_008456 [Apiospora kogelbergensis]|uniref:uncharacterized protein n=1 Tax=Apiospora kogelbergensis TaxID=1337665 RepID=UPI0031326C1D